MRVNSWQDCYCMIREDLMHMLKHFRYTYISSIYTRFIKYMLYITFVVSCINFTKYLRSCILSFNNLKHDPHRMPAHVFGYIITSCVLVHGLVDSSDNNVRGANMGPTWVLSAPDGPHVGSMTLTIRKYDLNNHVVWETVSNTEGDLWIHPLIDLCLLVCC